MGGCFAKRGTAMSCIRKNPENSSEVHEISINAEKMKKEVDFLIKIVYIIIVL